MKRTLAFALCASLLTSLGFGNKVHSSQKSQGAVSVLEAQQTQSFNRHPLPFETSPATPAGTGKQQPSFTTNSNSPSNPPNDPGYLADPSKGMQVGLPENLGDLNFMNSQGLSASFRTVYVVIIDGAGIPHPQLDANRIMSEDMDFVGGVVTNTHSAAVNSIMASLTNDGKGSYGLAGYTGKVKIIHARIFDNNGNSSFDKQSAAIQAVIAKKNAGSPIYAVVCPYGGIGKDSQEEEEFRAMTNAGIAVFAGAGPGTVGVNTDFCPACYNSANSRIIPVASLSASGTALNDTWSWGAIAAPTNVKVTVNPANPDSIATFGGVSAATGQPAAALALEMSVHPELSLDDALHRLEASCAPIAGVTFGRLDLFSSVTWQPVLVSQTGSPANAIALDSVTNTAGPFPVRTLYYTNGMNLTQTLVAFYSYNVDPIQLSSIVFSLTDAQGAGLGTLSAVSAMRLPDNPWLTRITVMIPDSLAGKGNVKFVLAYHGQTSGPLSVAIK